LTDFLGGAKFEEKKNMCVQKLTKKAFFKIRRGGKCPPPPMTSLTIIGNFVHIVLDALLQNVIELDRLLLK